MRKYHLNLMVSEDPELPPRFVKRIELEYYDYDEVIADIKRAIKESEAKETVPRSLPPLCTFDIPDPAIPAIHESEGKK
jgi:hypothetical protein